jgi:DNA-binding transcriptional regulator YiaG
MTALQFTTRRKKLFRSQAQAAEAMGVDQSTLSRWETGCRPVPGIVVKFLECIAEREHLEVLVGKYAPKNMGDTIPFP